MLEAIGFLSLAVAVAIAAAWFVVWRREQNPQARLAARSWRRYQEKLRRAEQDNE